VTSRPVGDFFQAFNPEPILQEGVQIAVQTVLAIEYLIKMIAAFDAARGRR
jgi:hypothetical protein